MKNTNSPAAPTHAKTGNTKLAPLWVVVLLCCGLVAVPVTIALAKYFSRYPVYTLEGVTVAATDGHRGYWMVYDSESVGKLRFFTRFCADYDPPFDPGDYLELLRYEDRGSCWSLKSEHAGVKIRRNQDGKTDSELLQHVRP